MSNDVNISYNHKYFQDMVSILKGFWAKQGCAIIESYDQNVGAGTLAPYTALRITKPEPWRICQVQYCRRPTDGRFGSNPNRASAYYQMQIILKPVPENIQELCLQSLEMIGISRKEHDIKFMEDDWSNPSIGASGLGYELWCDGMEITQFTYMQKVGGIDIEPALVPGEITYGLERLAMYIQDKDNYLDLDYCEGVKYGADSQAKFMSENLKALRAYYPTSADPTKYAELDPYEMKAFALPSKEGEIGTGMIVALGTIPEVAPIIDNKSIVGWGKAVTLGQGENFTIAKMLEAMGAGKGDQISVLAIKDNGIFVRTRYVIRADATTAELNEDWNSQGNAAAFDAAKTEISDVLLEEDGRAHAWIEPNGIYAACIVISRKGDGDKWLRSNARMWYLGDEAPQYQADYALPYWQFTGTDIVTTDPHFLNNADV